MGACATKIIEETDTEMILDTRGGVWIKFDKAANLITFHDQGGCCGFGGLKELGPLWPEGYWPPPSMPLENVTGFRFREFVRQGDRDGGGSTSCWVLEAVLKDNRAFDITTEGTTTAGGTLFPPAQWKQDLKVKLDQFCDSTIKENKRMDEGAKQFAKMNQEERRLICEHLGVGADFNNSMPSENEAAMLAPSQVNSQEQARM